MVNRQISLQGRHPFRCPGPPDSENGCGNTLFAEMKQLFYVGPVESGTPQGQTFTRIVWVCGCGMVHLAAQPQDPPAPEKKIITGAE